nr:PREDICTED: proline-rich protein 18 [Anolis carolinensis]|eukprot:XP_008123207.1 PREDICTED: proline-rich protein 18 [Anolis carolinensis]
MDKVRIQIDLKSLGSCAKTIKIDFNRTEKLECVQRRVTKMLPAPLPKQGASGGEAVRATPAAALSSPPPPAFYAGRFSLSLPPEAIRVLQRRSLEEENEEKQRRRHKQRRPRGGGSGGVGKSGPEWRHLLPVSLLNERHRYDDVEYEEEGAGEGEEGAAGNRTPARDEGLVRKCTEWLRGVERASARDRAGKLGSLPHLGTL